MISGPKSNREWIVKFSVRAGRSDFPVALNGISSAHLPRSSSQPPIGGSR
jgi:hypothetical protein